MAKGIGVKNSWDRVPIRSYGSRVNGIGFKGVSVVITSLDVRKTKTTYQ